MGPGGRLSTQRGAARRAGALWRWNRRRFHRTCALMCAALVALFGSAEARYVQARIETTDPLHLMDGLDVVGRKGDVVHVVSDPATLERLRGAGYVIHAEIEDLEAAYVAGIHGPAWGIYHTLVETEALLDSLHAACPSITTAPFPVGTSHQGRPIWALKISDNPDLDEDEPEVLIDGLHHAREMMSVETILDFAVRLCAGYGTDPLIRSLVDQRQIFLVPVVNPDGMAYNEQTNPSGGGMWRKNRRDNGDGTFGVDLNRNYPYQWGRDDGSSPEPASNVYRGPWPASEPETEAMIAFMTSRRLVTHLSMHSFLGTTLIPWGYTGDPSPDDDLLRAWARRLSAENGYTVAQPAEVLYLCSGMTTDYAYGEVTAKNRILSSTIEIGGSGFWPTESEVARLLEECRWPLIYATQSAGTWLAVAGWSIDGDGRIDPGETIAVTFAVENRAILDGAAAGMLTVTTDDAYVQLLHAATALPPLTPQDTTWAITPIRFAVDASTPQGHVITLRLRAATAGFVGEELVRLVVGRPPALFFDDLESGPDLWVVEGSWGLSREEAHSPTTSLTDSPGGPYDNYADSWARFAQPLDFSLVPTATLSFWHRYDTEESYDHCVVEASADGGATWRQLGPQYSGIERLWRPVELPLDQFVGAQAFTLRFRLETDVSITADGWYIDDVMIAGPVGNLPPPEPAPLGPPDGAAVETPTLSVLALPDPDGDPVSCGFFLYGDSQLTTLVAASGEMAVVEGVGSWEAPTPGDGVFWWRAYAFDGTQRSLLSPPWRFSTGQLGPSERPETARITLVVLPNPSPGTTSLQFELPQGSTVVLTVHDLAGRLVATPVGADLSAGRHQVVWDGLDSTGKRAGPGVYVARLSACGRVIERRLVRVD